MGLLSLLAGTQLIFKCTEQVMGDFPVHKIISEVFVIASRSVDFIVSPELKGESSVSTGMESLLLFSLCFC
jgi:hypothetical protein